MKIQSSVFKNPEDFNIGQFEKKLGLEDDSKTLFIVFVNSNREMWTNVLPRLHEAYPNSTVVGVTSAGHIAGEFIYDSECAITKLRFDKGIIMTKVFQNVSADTSFEIGEKLGELGNSLNAKAGLILSEGLHVNGSQLVLGINKVNNKTIFSGGLSADGYEFKETNVIYNNQILKDSLVVIYFDQNFDYQTSSAGGWNSFGVERIVTKFKNNVIFEIDDKPALELYYEYLGNKADLLPAYGLNFPICTIHKTKDGSPDLEVVRTLLAIDREKGSMTLAGDVAEGSVIKLMKSTRKDLIEAAQKNFQGQLAQLKLRDGDVLAFIVSCVGRRIVMGVNTEEELEHASGQVKVHPLGFYSYGEISSQNECAQLFNQTFTLTLIQEKL